MSVDPAVLRALASAGATADMIVAAVEADFAIDEAKKAEKRADAAARKRASRAASRDVTGTECDNNGQSVTDADPPASPSNGFPTPLPITTPPPSTSPSPADDWPSDFEQQFWTLYPNKVGKGDAMAKLRTVRRNRTVDWTELIAGLRRYVAKTDDRPWCNPATWLHQQRWTDQPATPVSANGQRPHDNRAPGFAGPAPAGPDAVTSAVGRVAARRFADRAPAGQDGEISVGGDPSFGANARLI